MRKNLWKKLAKEMLAELLSNGDITLKIVIAK